MRKLTLIAALLASTTAFAADLPSKAPSIYLPPSAPSWTGFYLGINGGGGWATEDQSIMGGNTISSTVVATGAVPSTVATRGGGGLFGVTAGYNFQWGQYVVLGAEGDFDWSNIGGSGGQNLTLTPLNVPISLSTTGSQKLDWLASIRARLGYLVTPTTLVYATGGAAFGEVNTQTAITLAAPAPFGAAATANNSSTKSGWTVGGGVEQKLFGNWSVKGEYRYTDLGSVGSNLTATVNTTPVAFNTSQNLKYNTVLVGLNYKF